MGSRWTATEDTAVRLAAALDWEHGGRRLVELADRLGRTEGAVRQRASRLRTLQLEGDASDGLGPSNMGTLLPQGLGVTIPMALLLGILMGLGRLRL